MSSSNVECSWQHSYAQTCPLKRQFRHGHDFDTKNHRTADVHGPCATLAGARSAMDAMVDAAGRHIRDATVSAEWGDSRPASCGVSAWPDVHRAKRAGS